MALLIRLLILFLALASFNIFAETPQTKAIPANADATTPTSEGEMKIKSYPVYEDINLISKQSVEYLKPRIVVRSLIPQLVSDEGDEDNVKPFNDAVDQIVKDEIAKFQKQATELSVKAKKGSNELTIDYNTSAITSGEIKIISIRFSIQGYIIGMAHPFHYHRSFNFDLENNQPIQLNELFADDSNYLDFLSTYSRTSLARRLQDMSLIDEGTAPKAENFAVWNIKPSGLMFTFDEARVAAYVYGVQTVLVPYSLLKQITPHKSPIAPCVFFHRSCGSDTLLTGGFIDEAANTHHRRLNPVLSKV